MIIDAKTGEHLADIPTGVFGQISYRRLINLLRSSGEITESEQITHIEFTDTFLRYRIERR